MSSKKWILIAVIVSVGALSVVIAQPPPLTAPAASDPADVVAAEPPAAVTPPVVPAPPTPVAPGAPARAAEPPVAVTPPVVPAPPTPAVPGTAPVAANPAQPGATPPPTQPRRGRGGRTAEVPPDTAAGTVTVIVRLKNAQAVPLQEMLRSLMDDRELGAVRTAFDPVGNSVILRGEPKDVDSVQRIIVQIDDESHTATATPARRPMASAGPNPYARGSAVPVPQYVRGSAVPVPQVAEFTPLRAAIGMDAKSSQEYMKLESQAADIARAYRQGAETLGAEHPQQRERREQLTKLVEKSFDVRQDGQNQELRQLKERITKVEQSISKRVQNRSQIIDKRVKDLLNDEQELDWNAGAQSTPTVVKTNGVTVYGVQPNPNVPYGGELPLAVPVPQPPGLPAVPGLAPTGTIPAPTVVPSHPNLPSATPPLAVVPRLAQNVITEQLIPQAAGAAQRQALGSASEIVLQKEAEVNALKKRLKEGDLENDEKYQLALLELQSAKRQLERTRQEFGAQLKLLQLDVDAASAEVTAAMAELETQDKLVKDGTVPASALEKLKAQVLHAEVKLKKAATLLELHSSALKSLDGASDATTTGAKR